MTIEIKKIINQNNIEIGVIVSVRREQMITPQQKITIENQIYDYIVTNIYNGKVLHIYKHWESNTANVTAFLDVINNIEGALANI